MAASMLSATTMSATRAAPVQASMAAFSGLKSTANFPGTAKKTVEITKLASNGGRVQCFNVWPPEGLKKFETLSYLPPLTREQLIKQIDFLIKSKWVPCLEFEVKDGWVYREHHHSPGYYDGRYWTMWKLPMYGCTDAVQVVKELDEAIKAYPHAYVRIIGFDNVRQVQCISFIAALPSV